MYTMCIPPLISNAGGSRYILRFVSAWVQKWFDLNTDAGVPGGVFWSGFSSTKSGRFSHENIFNQDVFVRKKENWAWQLYVILGFYNVILCFGLYFSIHTKKR